MRTRGNYTQKRRFYIKKNVIIREKKGKYGNSVSNWIEKIQG